jgi:hypothetical protein
VYFRTHRLETAQVGVLLDHLGAIGCWVSPLVHGAVSGVVLLSIAQW